MSTSGVSTWSLTRDSIINASLRKLGVLAEGDTASSAQLTTGAEALNSLMKALMVKGMPLWNINEYTFTTVLNTSVYNIGTGQTLNTPMPMKVMQAYRISNTGGPNIPMEVKSHFDYNLLPQNASPSVPIHLYYQPLATYGVIKLWPAPSDAVTTVTISYQRPVEDVTASTDNVDFPAYWTDAIIYSLAWRLAPEYGVPIQDRATMAKEATMFVDEALSFGSEESSVFMMPDWSGKK
jgi:hypothetical protein